MALYVSKKTSLFLHQKTRYLLLIIRLPALNSSRFYEISLNRKRYSESLQTCGVWLTAHLGFRGRGWQVVEYA